MIEVVYKDEKKEIDETEEMLIIPKNIRQIGLCNCGNRIYVEDYVYTFLKKTAEEESDKRMAILTGEVKWSDGIRYFFIRGAVLSEETNFLEKYTEVMEKSWKKLLEESAYYFPDQEVVGWFWAQPEAVLELTETLRHMHWKLFGNGEKILMLMNMAENEEIFFHYENGFFSCQKGYYLYYEKNPFMQVYMSERRPDYQEKNKEEIPDEAVKQFRKIIKSKKEPKETEEKASVFSYAAAACLVLVLVTVGSRFYQNYRQLKLVEQEMEAAALLLEEENINTKNTEKMDLDKEQKLPTVIPVISESPQKEKTEEDTSIRKEEKIYNEESDVRKAERRIAQEEIKKENSEPVSYVIRPGDTIYQISMMKYGSLDEVSEICRLNNLTDEEIIYPGQVILLP